MKRQVKDWEKIFANYVYNKGFLYLEHIKNSDNSVISRKTK
jgi:hypothetical protein